MKTLLTIAAAGALLSAGALAQTAAPLSAPAAASENAKTSQTTISTPAVPRSTTANASASSLDLRQQFRADLQKAGFTDIRVRPDSFLIEAKDHEGHPVTMVINPDSVTEVVAEGASNAGMNNSGATPDRTGSSAQEFLTLQANDRMSSKIVGLEVHDASNKEIGTIKDIAYAGRRIQAYIIDVGGFLGMGSHEVAVDPSDVKITYDSNSNDWRATMNTTEAQLKSAPEFKDPTHA